jgi:murein DD-endopeptidase MepM/ murein hydrolase activator NlpD
MSRAGLAIGATVFTCLSVVVNDLPASAATVQHDEYQAELQTFDTGNVMPPVAVREALPIETFTPVQWPLSPSTTVSSGFGMRVAPCRGCSSDHQGVDFDPGYGTNIVAIADGVVVESQYAGGLGQHVVVQHEIDGVMVQSVYGHMIAGSARVSVGDKVTRGELLGLVGSTGASTGPHLHFEIRPGGGMAVEPLSWLAKNVTEAWK